MSSIQLKSVSAIPEDFSKNFWGPSRTVQRLKYYVQVSFCRKLQIPTLLKNAAKDSEQRAATRSLLSRCFALPKDLAKDPNVSAVMV